MDESVLIIGGALGGNIVLRPLWPLHSTNDQYSFQIRMHVEIEASPFRASFDDDFEFPGFVSFRNELEALYRSLKGQAEYESYDAPLRFKIVGDGLGHMLLTGEVCDSLFSYNKLSFRMEFDQSHLPPLLSALDALIAQLTEAGFLKVGAK